MQNQCNFPNGIQFRTESCLQIGISPVQNIRFLTMRGLLRTEFQPRKRMIPPSLHLLGRRIPYVANLLSNHFEPHLRGSSLVKTHFQEKEPGPYGPGIARATQSNSCAEPPAVADSRGRPLPIRGATTLSLRPPSGRCVRPRGCLYTQLLSQVARQFRNHPKLVRNRRRNIAH